MKHDQEPPARVRIDRAGREYAFGRDGRRISVAEARRRNAIAEHVHRAPRDETGKYSPYPHGIARTYIHVRRPYSEDPHGESGTVITVTARWSAPDGDVAGAVAKAIADASSRQLAGYGGPEDYEPGGGFIFPQEPDVEIEYADE